MDRAAHQELDLPAHMDLDAVDGVRDWLTPALERGDIILNGSGVERVYSNCLMLLLAAHKEAVAHGADIRLVSPSLTLQDAIERLGFSQLFAPLIKE